MRSASTPGHHIRIAGLADAGNAAVLDANVGFHDPLVVNDQHVGNDAIERDFRIDARGLSHAVANDFAGAEHAFVAVDGEVLLDLEGEAGVAELDLVTDRRSEQGRIVAAFDLVRHVVPRQA